MLHKSRQNSIFVSIGSDHYFLLLPNFLFLLSSRDITITFLMQTCFVEKCCAKANKSSYVSIGSLFSILPNSVYNWYLKKAVDMTQYKCILLCANFLLFMWRSKDGREMNKIQILDYLVPLFTISLWRLGGQIQPVSKGSRHALNIKIDQIQTRICTWRSRNVQKVE